MLDYGMMRTISENAIDNRAYNTWQEELKAIDEATYYGKSQKLLGVEHILDEMIEIGKLQNGVTSQKFNDKMYEVAEKLGNIFGFYSFQINNSILMSFPNILVRFATTSGCTLCHGAIFKYTKMVLNGKSTYVIDLDKNHQGVRFKSGARYSMRMFLSVNLFKPSNEYSFTGGQILAIMLHEIGHNFYVGPVREITADFLGMLTAADLVIIMQNFIMRTLIVDGSEFIDRYLPEDMRKGIIMINGWLGNLLEAPISIVNTLKTPLIIIKNLTILSGLIAGTFFIYPVSIWKAFLKYDAEKYSDAFATSYGYGVELSQALNNLTHRALYRAQTYVGQDIHDILFTMYKLPIEVIMCLVDVHPNNQGRLMNDIQYLEACGKDIKDPKLRKEYEQNMKEMYALRDAIKSYNGGNPIEVSNKFRAAIQDLIGISDIKEIGSDLKPKYTKYANIDM